MIFKHLGANYMTKTASIAPKMEVMIFKPNYMTNKAPLASALLLSSQHRSKNGSNHI